MERLGGPVVVSPSRPVESALRPKLIVGEEGDLLKGNSAAVSDVSCAAMNRGPRLQDIS